jgi:sugar phosphate isomerase/epimerase
MKPISLQLYSVREQMNTDVDGVLRKVADFGYAGVEFGGSVYGRDPKQFRKFLDELGLKTSSTHFGVANKDNLQQILDFAGIFGNTIFVSGYRREAWDTADGIREMADAFQAGAELLKPHGLIQACHNHWWEFQQVDGRLAIEIFLERAPGAQAQLDIYWASRFGEVDVPAFLRKWARRCPTLHVKDGPLAKDQPHTAVGSGKMDIPAVIRAADENVLQWLPPTCSPPSSKAWITWSPKAWATGARSSGPRIATALPFATGTRGQSEQGHRGFPHCLAPNHRSQETSPHHGQTFTKFILDKGGMRGRIPLLCGLGRVPGRVVVCGAGPLPPPGGVFHRRFRAGKPMCGCLDGVGLALGL